jgi:hypothetical protein
MLGGIHFFTGSALSLSLTKNIYIAFLIGFVSHHLFDRLPHLDLNIFDEDKYELIKNWDLKVWLLVILEFLFFLILTFYFLGNFDFSLQKIAVFGGIGAIFPDILTIFIKNFFTKLKIFNFYLNFHKNFHFELKKKNYLLPVFVELLLVVFSIILFLGISTNY